MQSNIKYGIYFSKGFLILIDELLNDVYSESLKREDFLHLFYTLERGRQNNNAIELPSDIRDNFGRTKINGIMTWKFKELVDICVAKDIIFTSGYSNFEGKQYCKSYGYTERFNSKILENELEFQFCDVSEKTFNVLNNRFKIPDDPILLKHYETISKLDIDLKKCEPLLKTLPIERLIRTVREIAIIKYKDRITVVDDPRTGRIYTSFNMMKKELREFCTYNGEELQSLDLKSSQPYFLASLLLQENPNNYEVQRFYKLVTEGDIYDWLIEKWGGFDYHSYEEARKFVKELFFSYLYKDNRGTNSAQMVMQEYFKEVYNIIKIKKRTEELWLSLQKLEANIFISVCNQYVSQGCLSVHDSLYFPVSMRKDIESSLSKQFNLYSLINYQLT